MPRTTDMEVICKQYIKKIYNEEKWDPFKHNIGPRIKYLRERMGYGKSEFSKRAKIDRSSLERFENNVSIPKGKTLLKILDALYCDVVMFTKVEDIDEFKVSSEKTITQSKNIFEFKEELEAQLNQSFSYYIDGERRLVPAEVIDVIRNNVTVALEVLDTIPCDKEQK